MAKHANEPYIVIHLSVSDTFTAACRVVTMQTLAIQLRGGTPEIFLA